MRKTLRRSEELMDDPYGVFTKIKDRISRNVNIFSNKNILGK